MGVVVKGTLSVMDEVTTDPCPVIIYTPFYQHMYFSSMDEVTTLVLSFIYASRYKHLNSIYYNVSIMCLMFRLLTFLT